MAQDLLNYVPIEGLFKDRVILVTGAAMGIGRAAALAYARFGAVLVLLDKQVPLLEQLYDDIVTAGGAEPAIYPLDLQGATNDDYEALAENVREQMGRLDGVLLNGAWLAAFMPIKQHDVDLWSKMITTNLHANFLLVKACIPLLEEADDAAILFSSDTTDKAYYGAFGVAKGAMNAFCDILAQEHDHERGFIRVNRINSGPLRTSTRVLNFPGEHPDSLAGPDAVVGPYLYFMGPDAEKRTGEALDLGRLPPDASWPGDVVSAE
uniref:NAD(P)-dependent dehydrogenase, short-chain alcohol dehydrogenase family n=1 Tax=uncultured Thiotrichaceae bacterium TaxID=298394 RepID=A0A6S6TTY1_9GAMM|nr:MAG: NAD(P)-dependent dehydrogenase, short-chain alcohol dehydrogenase family [uncultured Thiotrichaceae bacterium]